MNLLYLYLFIGLIVGGISTAAMTDKNDKYVSYRTKLMVANIIVFIIVVVTWPIWVGRWIGNFFSR